MQTIALAKYSVKKNLKNWALPKNLKGDKLNLRKVEDELKLHTDVEMNTGENNI